MKPKEVLRVSVGEGDKYTVVMDSDGRLSALRYGKQWRDCIGDNLVFALASEVEKLRDFAESFLSPEEFGYAVTPEVRDEARIALGFKPCEFGKYAKK